MARTLIVANRLPVTVRDGSAEFAPWSGGLAAGLRGFHQRTDSLWLGGLDDEWRLTDAQRERVTSTLGRHRMVRVPLPPEQAASCDEGFCHGVLWPLFHYQLDRVPLDSRDWDAYRAVNMRFAEATAESYQTGDLIWVHDYQLMLVPDLVRQLVPHARIGFFLHTPFPSYEVFRTLSWRRDLLAGLLGADLIGFNTFPYVRYFARAVHHILGIESTVDRMQVRDREIRIGAFPLGVDAKRFEALAGTSRVAAEHQAVCDSARGRRVVVGVDPADDTTGVPRRLLAFERLLERNPSLSDEIRLIQAVVPSRTGETPRRQFRRQLDEIAGRINTRFGTIDSRPVHDVLTPVTLPQLVALYRAADVMLVTALRDGMNLVAKEFVASRTDEDGVLVLSEFTGAADELGEALCINPYDVDGVADRILEALRMPRDERRARMRALRQRIRASTSRRWADAFLAALERQPAPAVPSGRSAGPPSAALARRVSLIDDPVLLLDYDGTLVPLASAPELACPDAGLLDLLRRIAASLQVHVVSGRGREDLDRWFGSLPVSLWAEHGAWHRPGDGEGWHSQVTVPIAWVARVRAVFEEFAACTPGAFVEEKSVSIAWHYRAADPEFGERQARQMRLILVDVLRGGPADVLHGSKVIEVRPQGTHKGRIVEQVLLSIAQPERLIAIGDDRTDEEMFVAMPFEAVTIHVGPGPSQASYRLTDTDAVRRLLEQLTHPIRLMS